MTRMAPLVLAGLIMGCAERTAGPVAIAPCPPGALSVCHAAAGGCDAPPFCYRTVGQVDCYLAPEASRRTVDEALSSPAGCVAPAPPMRL